MKSAIESTLGKSLEALKIKAETAAKQLKAAYHEDEANFYKVKWNIIDIFEKMLGVSVKHANSLSPSTELEWLTIFESHYMGHFEKIPKAWQLNLEQCIQHDLAQEAHVERLKIETANDICVMAKHIIGQLKAEMEVMG